MISPSDPQDVRLLSEKQILELIPVSKSTLRRWVKSKTFPAGFRISERIVVWRGEDVRQWIANAPELQQVSK